MIGIVLNILLYAVGFLLIIGPIIVIHEFGHFLTAKWCGVAIDRFSIGFGRALWSRTDKSGVEWRIGWMPLGGYVRFAGDENDASVPDQEDLDQMRRRIIAREGPGAEKKYLAFKPLWQRALIVAAGPAVNFITAIVLFALISMTLGDPITPPVVRQVTPGSAAEVAGFRVGDRVLRAGNTEIRSYEELTDYILVRQGSAIPFLVRRDGQTVTLTATPRREFLQRRFGMEIYGARLGLGFNGQERELVRKAPGDALVGGVQQCWHVVSTTVTYLGRVVTGRVSGEQIGGPIQVVATAGGVTRDAVATEAPMVVRVMYVLSLIALISVSVGFFNLLPIPVLDGGHLAFYAYEAVAKRPLPASLQAAGYRVGLALLLCLMLFATWNDLQRFGVFRTIGGLFS